MLNYLNSLCSSVNMPRYTDVRIAYAYYSLTRKTRENTFSGRWGNLQHSRDLWLIKGRERVWEKVRIGQNGREEKEGKERGRGRIPKFKI